jgi:MFS family permease
VRSARERAAAVARVTSGNFLEMYDFMVYGYYAPSIGRAYFPTGSDVATLLLSFATFGAGFLMRPVGAVVLGAYVDRHGRRAGLLLTLALMAVGTLTIACTPGYATIGVAAPLIVLAGRLLQGLSAGVELGGVSVYLAEIATPGRVGFYVSWQSASQQAAVITAGVLGYAIARSLGAEALDRWGWRVPILVGCAIVPFLLWVRRSLEETDAFLAHARDRARRPGTRELLGSLATSWKPIALGVAFVTMSTVSFYVITAYTPTFGTSVLHLSKSESLAVTVCVGASNLFWLPVMGAASDRAGRRPLLLAATVVALATAYPAMTWLAAAPSFGRLLATELWLSLVYATYNGAMVVHLTEMMPAAARTTAFSLAYSSATAVFGGFTPFVCTYLVFRTHDRAMPGAWLSFAATLGLMATLVGARRRE